MKIEKLVCRMRAVRLECDDSDDEIRTTYDCGEAVFYSGLSGGAFYRSDNDGDYDGPPEDSSTWKVECAAGHVLFVPDGDSPPPFSSSEFLGACADLLEWVDDS